MLLLQQQRGCETREVAEVGEGGKLRGAGGVSPAAPAKDGGGEVALVHGGLGPEAGPGSSEAEVVGEAGVMER